MVVVRIFCYILPLKTSLNSPGAAQITKVVTMLTYECKLKISGSNHEHWYFIEYFFRENRISNNLQSDI